MLWKTWEPPRIFSTHGCVVGGVDKGVERLVSWGFYEAQADTCMLQ